jgi:hypothetical protein
VTAGQPGRTCALWTREGQRQAGPWTFTGPSRMKMRAASGAILRAQDVSCQLGGFWHHFDDCGPDVRHQPDGRFAQVTVRICQCGTERTSRQERS